MRITPLASGSAGNSTLVESGDVRVLIDAGLRCEELEARVRAAGVSPGRVDAVFVTHRHKDHVRGTTEFARRNRAAVLATRPTARAVGSEAQRRVRRLELLRGYAFRHLVLWPIPVTHDAPGTVALLIEDGPVRYGHATDLGCADGRIVDYLQNCDALLLEFNHDLALLENGDDPPHLKRRIRSDTGHLSNAQAADLLGRLTHPRLRHVWLAHLSRRNNRPELALSAARSALHDAPDATVRIAEQDAVGETVALRPAQRVDGSR